MIQLKLEKPTPVVPAATSENGFNSMIPKSSRVQCPPKTAQKGKRKASQLQHFDAERKIRKETKQPSKKPPKTPSKDVPFWKGGIKFEKPVFKEDRRLSDEVLTYFSQLTNANPVSYSSKVAAFLNLQSPC